MNKAIPQRIALCIEYNGSSFHGWQIQRSDSVPTVQGVLEKALSKVAAHPVKLYCAGRTDTGVHATGQIVHFETDSGRPLKAWIRGVNTYLPSTVCVRWSYDVGMQFHARFSATARRYCYVIDNRSVRPAIHNKLVTSFHAPLDAKSMQEGAKYLLGERDFTSYRGSNCKSPTAMRNVMHLNVTRHGDHVLIDIKANAFLLHMVRNVAGVLMEIGAGRKPAIWAKEVLEARDRSVAAMTARPHGLYLINVSYPEDFNLPVSEAVIPVGLYSLTTGE